MARETLPVGRRLPSVWAKVVKGGCDLCAMRQRLGPRKPQSQNTYLHTLVCFTKLEAMISLGQFSCLGPIILQNKEKRNSR